MILLPILRKPSLAYITKIFYCTTVELTANYNANQLKFTQKEEEKILNVINQCSNEQLKLICTIPNTALKSLEKYKSNRGPFQCINDIRNVEGLNTLLLDEFCTKILSDQSGNYENEKNFSCYNNKVTTSGRKAKSFHSPPLANTKLSTVVAVHLNPFGVSWAQLSISSNILTHWQCKSFEKLPHKMLPHETFDLAQKTVADIPSADAYVLESGACLNLTGPTQSVSSSSYTQHLELFTMLHVLINASSFHNPEHELGMKKNKIHFLRYKLPARFFKLVIGNETISAASTVDSILKSPHSNLNQTNLHYTIPNIDDSLKENYTSKTPQLRELLGLVLLQMITFNDLCIKRSATSIKEVTGGSLKN